MKKSDLKNRIYVGNLPLSLDGEDLKEIFKEFGEILEANVERDYYKRSKGYGSVEFMNGAEAKEAIDGMNGEEFQGRRLTLKVFEDKSKL